MKNLIKKYISPLFICTAALLILFAAAPAVYAETLPMKKLLATNAENDIILYDIPYLEEENCNEGVFANIKVDKPAIVALSSDEDSLRVEPKKKGTAVVTFDVIKNDGSVVHYSCTVKVYAYTNPFKSFKIGSKNYAAKYKKTFIKLGSDERFSAYGVKQAVSGKLNVKLNKNWKIDGNQKMSYSWLFSGKDPILQKNGKKVSLKKGDSLLFSLKNTVTKGTYRFYFDEGSGCHLAG